MKVLVSVLALASMLLPVSVSAQSSLPLMTLDSVAGEGQSFTLTIQVLALMTALMFLPGIVLTMTSFTRIIIVLSILRQALGTAQTPPNPVLLGLALFLTFFVMAPVLNASYDSGVAPYLDGTLPPKEALAEALKPLREFMLGQTRESDLETFVEIVGRDDFQSPEDVPMSILVPAFITSELKTAFQIGFLLFIPFVVIDLVVASVLMSMGMMMLSPMLVSLPFKIMLFVLVDGWALLIRTLAGSFFI